MVVWCKFDVFKKIYSNNLDVKILSCKLVVINVICCELLRFMFFFLINRGSLIIGNLKFDIFRYDWCFYINMNVFF